MPPRKKLLWQIFPTYLVIIILSLGAVAWYASSNLAEFYVENTGKELTAQANLTAYFLQGKISKEYAEEVDSICKKTGNLNETRFTVILLSGEVIGDTDKPLLQMDNHADRPEIIEAFSGKIGESTRYSYTLKKEMMYVGVPIYQNKSVIGAVRASRPLPAIAKNIQSIHMQIAVGGLIIALFSAMLSFWVAKRINKPVQEMMEGAQQFAHGDLSYRLAVPNSAEMGALAEAMNKMAAQLDERLKTITQQRNELEAVLSSMLEAVMVIDAEDNILRINKAARSLLELPDSIIEGRPFREVIRNADLYRFMTEIEDTDQPTEGDIVLFAGKEKFLQAHGTLIKGTDKHNYGTLVVLNDITRIKKLENIRRDFVANVSHELKTPITSIKGFVETLQAGAIEEPENAIRFLDIVQQQADRLNAIIEDLLLLSRIESKQETEEIDIEEVSLKSILAGAIQVISTKANQKQIDIEMKCDDKLAVKANPQLIEQAMINLLDNAIKYSSENSSVKIITKAQDGEVHIRVEDNGIGIPKDQLPRLFERFYRVDKARSREMGGTGLGLAIVKHIVNSHKGHILVESEKGEGSAFTIVLPM